MVCSDSATNTSSATRRLFSLALLAYCTAWLVGFVFVSRVFGIKDAIGLSTLPAIPFVVGIRMRSRWQSLLQREFVLFFTLLILVFGATGGVVWNWCDTGTDRQRAIELQIDLKHAEFRRLVHEDPAFRNVEFSETKPIRGTVASRADYDRLYTLAIEHNIGCKGMDVSLGTGQ